MKKKVILLLILCLLLTTGCSISIAKVDDKEYIINNILLEESNLNNTGYKGYELYIPNTLKLMNKSEYNTILKDEYNNEYYIYVDAVSYLNKAENTYKEDKNSYYSKKITSKNGKKDGYIEINKVKNKYFVEQRNCCRIELLHSLDFFHLKNPRCKVLTLQTGLQPYCNQYL